MSASSVLIMLRRGVLPADVGGNVIGMEIAAYHQEKMPDMLLSLRSRQNVSLHLTVQQALFSWHSKI